MALFLEPFAPLFELSRDLDRMLASARTATPSFLPPADVVVNDDAVTVTMDVPGLTAEDLSIEVVDDLLTVRGERAFERSSEDGDGRASRRLERGYGKFERALRVPKGLDPDAIEASLSDGVLTVRIPMPEEGKPRRIEITTGDARPELVEATSHDPSEEREADSVAA